MALVVFYFYRLTEEHYIYPLSYRRCLQLCKPRAAYRRRPNLVDRPTPQNPASPCSCQRRCYTTVPRIQQNRQRSQNQVSTIEIDFRSDSSISSFDGRPEPPLFLSIQPNASVTTTASSSAAPETRPSSDWVDLTRVLQTRNFSP